MGRTAIGEGGEGTGHFQGRLPRCPGKWVGPGVLAAERRRAVLLMTFCSPAMLPARTAAVLRLFSSPIEAGWLPVNRPSELRPPAGSPGYFATHDGVVRQQGTRAVGFLEIGADTSGFLKTEPTWRRLCSARFRGFGAVTSAYHCQQGTGGVVDDGAGGL